MMHPDMLPLANWILSRSTWHSGTVQKKNRIIIWSLKLAVLAIICIRQSQVIIIIIILMIQVINSNLIVFLLFFFSCFFFSIFSCRQELLHRPQWRSQSACSSSSWQPLAPQGKATSLFKPQVGCMPCCSSVPQAADTTHSYNRLCC